jgi:hypothetical protein
MDVGLSLAVAAVFDLYGATRVKHYTFLMHFLSARKADLKKGFQHLVVVVVLLVVVVGTRVKKRF